ncbi:MAG TPA: S41 family peptidase [Candidatus Polarisedimenticolia bacterium]|nr:S41 family peptidase [Candidatus Polarisedimenticolia bacterium]
MTRPWLNLFSISLFALASQISLMAQTNSAGSDFQEVYDLIRQHAPGISESELNHAAIQGLVDELAPKVSLVTDKSGTNAASGAEPLAQIKLFEGDIAYLRITQVEDGLARAVRAGYQQLQSTNKVSGIVLDLRYAGGSDYDAAVATADLFVGKSEPLLNWGKGVVSSHEKSDALTMPIAVLVNHGTTGAAEALAAMVRETGSGLILGSQTAGAAMVTRDFPLKNGEHLRIASAPVTLGDGAVLSTRGIKPDIDVSISLEAERAFYADAFLVVPDTNKVAGATNEADATSQPRVLFNEAELVREHKAGENPDEEIAKRPPEPKVPVISDPALARAIDLLKGLAVVRLGNS